MEKLFSHLVRFLFISMILIILSSLFFLDGISYACKTTLPKTNFEACFVILILFFLSLIGMRFLEKLGKVKEQILKDNRRRMHWILGATLGLFFFQRYLAYNILFLSDWDVSQIWAASQEFAFGASENVISCYNFSFYPNNLLLMFVQAFCLKLHAWFGLSTSEQSQLMSIITFNCALNSCTCFLVYKTTELYCSSRYALSAFVFAILSFGISPWIVINYTDSLAILFPILTFYFYLTPRTHFHQSCISRLLAVLCGCLGYYIKPQCLIVLLALILFDLFFGTGNAFSLSPNNADQKTQTLDRPSTKTLSPTNRQTAHIISFFAKWRNVGRHFVHHSLSSNVRHILVTSLTILCTIFLLISMKIGINIFLRSHHIELNKEAALGPAHFFMMGMNAETAGVYSQEDVDFSAAFSTRKERDTANLHVALQRIRNMGPQGFLEHIAKKLLTTYNDGTFAWGKEGTFYYRVFGYPNYFASHALRSIFYNNGSHYTWFTGLEQVVWLAILLFGGCMALFRPQKNQLPLMLTWLGLTLYCMLFETRARYLYIYVPLFCVAAAVGLQQVTVKAEQLLQQWQPKLTRALFTRRTVIVCVGAWISSVGTLYALRFGSSFSAFLITVPIFLSIIALHRQPSIVSQPLFKRLPLLGWNNTKHWIELGVLFMATSLSFLQLELSTGNIGQPIKVWFFLKNLFTIAIFYLLTWLLCGRLWLALAVWGTGFSVLAIINYYTLQFRGIPVAPLDVLSAGTALQVLGNYRIMFTGDVAILFFVLAIFWLLAYKIKRLLPPLKAHWPLRGVICSLFVALFCWCYIGNLESALSIYKNREWVWTERYRPEGYMTVTMDKVFAALPQPAPAGYSETDLRQDAQTRRNAAQTEPAAEKTPHILFIVNESWYDWRQYTDFTTDRPATPFLDELDNCLRGFAVNPLTTTAVSEYELLNSTSMMLTPAQLPFTQLNMADSYGLTKYLTALGYETAGFHLAPARNYSRQTVYPALGFERYWFHTCIDRVRGEFTSDRLCFAQLGTILKNETVSFSSFEIDMEEISPLFYSSLGTTPPYRQSLPQFLYCLTIQNHGGYQRSSYNGGDYTLDESKHIHVTSGFEGITGQAEEYLTLLRYTDDAFADLIAELQAFDEPVIVCMVGDHQPNFTQPVSTKYTGQEAQMRLMATPFVIWANYPLPQRSLGDVGTIGMVQLAPLLLKTAGLPLSPFYDSILALENTVITPQYYQKDGVFYNYTDEEIDPHVQCYLYYAYNNIPGRAKNEEILFWPYGNHN